MQWRINPIGESFWSDIGRLWEKTNYIDDMHSSSEFQQNHSLILEEQFLAS